MRYGSAAALSAWLSIACGGAPATKPSRPPEAQRVTLAAKPEFASIEPFGEQQHPVPEGLAVLEAEMSRAMAALRARGELAPYFIGQQFSQYEMAAIGATNGALTNSNRTRIGALMTDVRVGNHDLDSSHPVEGEGGGSSVTMAPLDPKDLAALRHIAWQEIDQEYQSASERFLVVKSRENVRVDIEDRSGDFTREKAVQHIGAPAPPLELSEKEWEARLRELSARLRDKPDIYSASVTLEAHSATRWIVNSEGTKIQTGERYYRLMIGAESRAEDGMELSHGEQFVAAAIRGLPSDETLRATVDRVATELSALRSAKPAEPFVGPAILQGRAAGVFFHETFGHRVEGERQKFDHEGQTFAKKIGERVMPPFLNVYDDPRLTKLQTHELGGFYRFDDEGVPAQRASLIEAGVLKGFLMGRVPVRGIVKSNGHGRRMSGAAMARQANLVIEPSEAIEDSELRQRLIAEAKRQKKPYGLMFAEIQGGYTQTARESTQGYKLMPIMVYRVYTDGRPDELIRGVDIVGTPLISLTKVLAAGRKYEVFNGSCGAESGWIPVSAISPSLLVQQIEVALRDKGSEKPPVLPPPPNQKEASR